MEAHLFRYLAIGYSIRLMDGGRGNWTGRDSRELERWTLERDALGLDCWLLVSLFLCLLCVVDLTWIRCVGRLLCSPGCLTSLGHLSLAALASLGRPLARSMLGRSLHSHPRILASLE